jgi:hypothetical protein
VGISIVLNAIVSAAAFHVPLTLRSAGGVGLVIGATAFFNFSTPGGPIERQLPPWARTTTPRLSAVTRNSRNSADEAESGQLLPQEEPLVGTAPILGRALSEEEMCRPDLHLDLDAAEIEMAARVAAAVNVNSGALPAGASPRPGTPVSAAAADRALSPRVKIPAGGADTPAPDVPLRIPDPTPKPCGQTDGATTLPLRTVVGALRGGLRETCSQRSPRGDIRGFTSDAGSAGSPLTAGAPGAVPKAFR